MGCQIGDIGRFANPKEAGGLPWAQPQRVPKRKLARRGTPQTSWSRRPIRALARPSRLAGLLKVENPLRKWGLALASRRGRNEPAVAVVGKLAVAAWARSEGLHRIRRHSTVKSASRAKSLSWPPNWASLPSAPFVSI